jgi:hypothetical protein
MGRPFHPRKGQADAVREATESEDEIDELTLHWINQNTMPCRVCGNRVERSEGCDYIECLCGHQFCYRCGKAYVACRCNPEDDPEDAHSINEDEDAPIRDRDGHINYERGQGGTGQSVVGGTFTLAAFFRVPFSLYFQWEVVVLF